jgi:hypothetical protein
MFSRNKSRVFLAINFKNLHPLTSSFNYYLTISADTGLTDLTRPRAKFISWSWKLSQNNIFKIGSKRKLFHLHSETVGFAILPGHCLYGDSRTLYLGLPEKSRSTILNWAMTSHFDILYNSAFIVIQTLYVIEINYWKLWEINARISFLIKCILP